MTDRNLVSVYDGAPGSTFRCDECGGVFDTREYAGVWVKRNKTIRDSYRITCRWCAPAMPDAGFVQTN